ncbi:hypothetical protein R80B4_01810 [Fibrobacteres bacterium R8-0-B4]
MRARLYTALLIAAGLAVQAAAQVTVEDEIVTGEVSLFEVKAEKERSLAAAMGLSLALPGMGHYYIDRPKSAFVYLSVDLASLFGALVFYGLADTQEKGARSYAASAAMIRNALSDEAYWRQVGAYMDAAEYNESIELSRGNAADLYQNPENWWHWADKEQQDEYNDLRQKARNFRVTASFFVGALVVNRILSTVDLRVFRKKSLSSGVRFEAALTPDARGTVLLLKTNF